MKSSDRSGSACAALVLGLSPALAVCQVTLPVPAAGFSFNQTLINSAGDGRRAERAGAGGSCGSSIDPTPDCANFWLDRVGAARHAMSFNGVDHYAILPDPNLGGDFSLAAWVKFDRSSPDWEAIIDLGNGANLDNLYFGRLPGSDELVLLVYEGGQVLVDCRSAPVVAESEWVHLAATHRDGAQRIYRNGVPVASCDSAGEPPRTARSGNYLGRSHWGDHLLGSVDEVAIFDRALSAAQVGRLAQSGMPATQGVLGLYGFDGTTLDSSGHFEHGEPIGDVAFAPGVASLGSALWLNSGLNGPGQGHVALPDLSLRGTVTVAAWVLHGSVASWSRIVDLGGGTQDDNILFGRYFGSSDLVLEVYQGGTSLGQCVATNAIQSSGDQWEHFAGIWADGAQRIYRNGVLLQSCSFAGGVPEAARPNSWVGRSNWPGDGAFSGRIDALWIVSGALSGEEIARLATIPSEPCLDDGMERDGTPDSDDVCAGASPLLLAEERPAQLCDADSFRIPAGQLQAGRPYLIETIHLDLGVDTFLQVGSGCGGPGVPIAEDDDGGPGLGSRVLVYGGGGADLEVRVTHLGSNHSVGAGYSLRVIELPDAVFRDGFEALPLLP